MKVQKTPYQVIALLMASIITVTGCQPTPSATETQNATVVSPEILEGSSIQINAEINLDPALAQDADSLMVSQYLYEGLVRLDAKGEPQPAIAETWVISDDQLDYIFTLRPDAKFSDGTLITPDTIADNFNRWFDPESPLRGNGKYEAWQRIFQGFNNEKDEEKRAKSPVDGIQKVDINTVLIHLNRPVPEILVYLADPAFAILNTNALLAEAEYGKKGSTIISSGPYMISAWTEAGLILSPNPNYWGAVPEKDLNFIWR